MIPNSYTFEHNVQIPTMQYVTNLKLKRILPVNFLLYGNLIFKNHLRVPSFWSLLLAHASES